MKPRLAVFLAFIALVLAGLATAQTPPAGRDAVIGEGRVRTAAELDDLLGPVALYPDALVAVILPAATKPIDIVMAVRYLQNGGSPSRIELQPWDDSVRALAHYRETLEWLDTNLLWTRDVAEAFVIQPEDVMRSIQRLRRVAYNAGTLQNTAQHKLIVEADEIRIVPADPEVIYVPRYDTRVAYVERPVHYSSPVVSFGIGYSVGSWLRYDCDWSHRRLFVIDDGWHWHTNHDWRYTRFYRGPSHYRSHWTHWSAPTRAHFHGSYYNRYRSYYPGNSPRHYEPRHVAPPPAHRPGYSDRHHDRGRHHDRDRHHDDNRRSGFRRDYDSRPAPVAAPAPEVRRPAAPDFRGSVQRQRPEYRGQDRREGARLVSPGFTPPAARVVESTPRPAPTVSVPDRNPRFGANPAPRPPVAVPSAPRSEAPVVRSAPTPTRAEPSVSRDNRRDDSGPRHAPRSGAIERPLRMHEH